MMDLAAAGTAVSTLKGAFDLTKTFLDIQGTVKIQAKVIELQGQILGAQQSAMSAQQTQTALLERIKHLEAEIARLKEWDAGKDEYRLRQAGPGCFVYSPKEEPTPAKPNHWLCVGCFENRKHRSVLQNQGRAKDQNYTIYGCPECKTTFQIQYRAGPHQRGEPLSDGTTRDSA